MQGRFALWLRLAVLHRWALSAKLPKCTRLKENELASSDVWHLEKLLARHQGAWGRRLNACAHPFGVKQVVELFEWGRHPRDHLRRVEVVAQRSPHLQPHQHSMCAHLQCSALDTVYDLTAATYSRTAVLEKYCVHHP